MEILIPLDGKPHSQRSVDLVLRVFNPAKIHVTLLHVVEKAESSMLLNDHSGHLEETYAKAEDQTAHSLLQKVAAPLNEAGAKVDVVIEEGSPLSTIQSASARCHAPIIIAAPGAHSEKEMLLQGSITARLMHSDFSGILIVAREFKKSKSGAVVFVLSGSAEAAEAVSFMAPLLSPSLKVLLLASTETIAEGGFFGQRQPFPWEKRLSEDPGELLKQASAAIEATGLKHEQAINEVPLDNWLSDFTKKHSISLFVLSRTRAEMIHRPITGSPSEKLFLRAPFSTALYCRPS